MKLKLVAIAAATLILETAGVAQSLDYTVYKTRVEPIFLKKRMGHARCVVCHAESNNAFNLQALPKGATGWTEEQSRKNFGMVARLVTAGNPDTSPLLRHPLAEDAGGDEFHSGGQQFTTKTDPEWKAIADWVRGAK